MKFFTVAFALLFSVHMSFAQGAGGALNFDGVDDIVQLTSPLSIGASSNTVEAWIRVPFVGTEGLTSTERVGSLLGSYNSTPHFNYEVYSNGAPRIYWNGGEVNTIGASSLDLRDNQWHHLAYVRDTASNEFRVYIDGVLRHSFTGVGSDLTMAAPHRIGGDNRASNGGPSWHGEIDEMRIWGVARTEAQIRESMCQFVPVAASGLLHYYDFNTVSGTGLMDMAGSNNGTLTNFGMTGGASNWVQSGAAVGDSSIQVYGSLSSATLSLGSSKGGVTVDSLQNTADGIHLYRVDGAPNSLSGITVLGTNDVYYGVFVAGDSVLEYNVTYDYSAYSLAVANEDSIDLFHRSGADSVMWMSMSARRDTLANTVKVSGITGSRSELILANFTGYVCSDPSSLTVSNVTFQSADISWVTGGALVWDVEFGAAGFSLGSGNSILGTTSNPGQLTGLTPSTTYDVYVRDNCGTLGSSNWVGPVQFTSAAAPACTDPTGLTALSVGANSIEIGYVSNSGDVNIQIGYEGFVLGTGTIFPLVNTSTYNFMGLNPSTKYDIYIQDTCNSLNASNWVGPITVKTKRGFLPGLGDAVLFDGDNDFIQMDSTLGLGSSSHTVEAWVKIPVIGTGGLNSGDRVGILLGSYNAANNFNYEFYSSGQPRVWWNAGEVNSSVSNVDLRDNKWHHVAWVRSLDSDAFYVYVDGEIVHTVGSAGTNVQIDVPHRIGGDNRDSNGGQNFHGAVDELRVWNVAKSADDIRAMMCQRADSMATNLVNYYPFDNGSVKDVSPSKAGGTMSGFSVSPWIVSGAALGDTSVYVHGASTVGSTLQLTSAQNGDLNLSGISGTPNGVYVYRNDRVPNTTTGVFDMGNQEVYYGVFVSEVGLSGTTYDVEYGYSAYPNAVANEANLTLYARTSAETPYWVNSTAVVDVALDVANVSSVNGRSEFLLADFVSSPCAVIDSFSVDRVTTDTAVVSWTGGSVYQDIEYGERGFVLGNGTLLKNVTSPYTISGLTYLTDYDVYLGDSCVSTSFVNWSGAFGFTTMDPCADIDSVVVTAVTGNSATFEVYPLGIDPDFQIQWGPSGFAPGFGILTSGTTNPVNLLGLAKSKEYQAYFRVDCDSIFSEWYGPVVFTTDSTGAFGVEELELSDLMSVYPNPSTGVFTVELPYSGDVWMEIVHMNGTVVDRAFQNALGEAVFNIDMSAHPQGVYYVRVKTEKAVGVVPVVLNR